MVFDVYVDVERCVYVFAEPACDELSAAVQVIAAPFAATASTRNEPALIAFASVIANVVVDAAEFWPKFAVSAMRPGYAAIGVRANVSVANVSVSPFVIDLLAVSATENRKLPADDASKTEMCVIVSEPDAHDAQTGSVAVIAFDPADAADQASTTRVVFADAFEAPDAPGSPVCSFA